MMAELQTDRGTVIVERTSLRSTDNWLSTNIVCILTGMLVQCFCVGHRCVSI